MRKLLALIEREYLEHRGAFLYAPAVILLLLALVLAAGAGLDRMRVPMAVATSTTKIFEVGFLVMGGLWFVYLVAALFFYFADAFNADRRNNSMLFWKSMPVSDFLVLASKILAALTIFPLLIFVATLIGDLIVTAFAVVLSAKLPSLPPPDALTVLGAGAQVSIFVFVTLFLALLWYLPFFAWVGMLSTLVGRWSIPLAFLIPGMVGVFERVLTVGGGPARDHFITWLSHRMEFGGQDESMELYLLQADRFEAVPALGSLVLAIDWTQLVGGVAVAVIFVYAASAYRRRFVAS